MEQKESLFQLLLRSLPTTVSASNNKKTANFEKNRNRVTALALEKFKYLSFNTPERISLLIFDMDYFKGQKAREVFTLEEYVHHIYAHIGLVPTFTCETTKGFQFGFHLKNHVYTKQEKSKKYVEDIKRAITSLLDLDQHASHRLYGIWRNPLQHKHWYSGEKDFELKDFYDIIKQYNKESSTKFTPHRRSWKNHYCRIIPDNVHRLGSQSREQALFLEAINEINFSENKSFESLHAFLVNFNSKISSPLTPKKITSIARDVFKRHQEGHLYLQSRPDKDVKRFTMQLPKISGLAYDEYLQEVKKRQQDAAHFTNKKRTLETKQTSIRHANQCKIYKNAMKYKIMIERAIDHLRLINEKITVVAIANVTRLNRRTIKKYMPKA